MLTPSSLSDNEDEPLSNGGEGIGAQLPEQDAAHSNLLGRGQWTAPNAPENYFRLQLELYSKVEKRERSSLG